MALLGPPLFLVHVCFTPQGFNCYSYTDSSQSCSPNCFTEPLNDWQSTAGYLISKCPPPLGCPQSFTLNFSFWSVNENYPCLVPHSGRSGRGSPLMRPNFTQSSEKKKKNNLNQPNNNNNKQNKKLHNLKVELCCIRRLSWGLKPRK